MLSRSMENFKNPVCAILWRDAAYSFEAGLPKELPSPQLTLGFIIDTNEHFTHIATNVAYDTSTNTMQVRDGMLIPEKAIISFRKIGDYNEKE